MQLLASCCLRVSLAISIVLFPTLTGCGYNFPGGGKPPGDINSIAVTVLDNRTAEIGIEAIFTNAILREFLRWKKQMCNIS